MASWMTDWAEKGGNLLNSLDSRVANFLQTADSAVVHPLAIPPRKLTSPRTVEITKPGIASPIAPQGASSRQCVADTTDVQLFEFLNNPAPMEQAISSLNASLPAPSSQQPLQPQSQVSVSNTSTDAATENRLLHQEVASLNQEIAELVKRNKRAESEAQLRNEEIDSLRRQVHAWKTRLDEMKTALQRSNSTSYSDTGKVKDLEVQVEKLTKTLTVTQKALEESENKASEALKLADLSSGRVEQLQQDIARLTRSLATYKEKATAILSDKEKVISDLRDQLNASGGDADGMSSQYVDENLRREYEQLREETISLRQEAEQRLMAASEMEERASEEHASLRRTINLLNQQLQLEKQLVTDSDAQIIELQRRLTAAEEAAKRKEATTASQLQSAEEEVARLRQCLSSEAPPNMLCSSISAQSPSEQPQPRADVEARVFELEARIRQLNDSLLTKQDSLEAALVQNHALKIRLERLEAECDAHLLETGSTRSPAFPGGYAQLPQNSPSKPPHGFARLHLIDTSLPTWLRGGVSAVDDWMIRLVAMLRRRPLIRLLLILYLGVFHVWLLCTLIFFAPPLSSPHAPPPPPLPPRLP
ncbi:Golgin subfamily A [Echinococcus multilocularis]|uniref:Golgin subfamily A n=1 Tax=Echinococcus multilocularis TaxID=6211 RepID=A0A068XXH3_ECHMU|nr:Golgin subfamily A [Echinococcus multilocularis]